ncbi:TadE/TadG family type IV pilus assembly protein [Sphingopyxis sp.]|uniref:TadE/TadG family type IV pilus assembly protein n=1 Tax=Sphingopyxis sp. TaxID=1908224 RepID=UPI002FC5BFA7
MTEFLKRTCARIVRRTRAAAHLARDVNAVVMIEVAFCVPILVLIGCGGIEYANLLLSGTRVNQIGLSAADNAARIAFGSNLSQPRVREIDINEVFAGVEEQSKGMNFKANGRVILSSVERNPDGGQWIHWQRCYGDLDVDSAYGPQGTGATGTTFPGVGVNASSGTAIMLVEVTYDYKSLLWGKWFQSRRIRETAAFLIREGRDLQGENNSGIFNPAPAATPSLCT